MQKGTNAADRKVRSPTWSARKQRLVDSAHRMTAALRAREARAVRLAQQESERSTPSEERAET